VVSVHNDFKGLVDRALQFWWESNPVEATSAGVHTYDDQLERLDRDSRSEILSNYERFVAELSSFESESTGLTREDRLDLAVLKASLDSTVQLERRYRRVERDATVYPDICLWSVYLLLTRDFAPVDQRLQSVLARMRQIPRVLAEGKMNLASTKGVPAAWTKLGMEVCEAGMSFFAAVVPGYASQSKSLAADIRKATAMAIEAMGDYDRFLREELMPASNGEYRLGAELFDYLLRNAHMLPYSTDQLLEIGRMSVETTVIELERVASEIDKGRTWVDLVADVKQTTPTADTLLDVYRDETLRAKRFVTDRDLVTIPAGESLDVVETPEFERGRFPYAGYMTPAPFERDQRGMLWVTPIDRNLPPELQQQQLHGHPMAGIPVIALHETYPGHHLQYLHAGRLGSPVRKVFGTPVFVEGWALYCEELMFQQGFLDQESRLFQLKDQLWRACRVIIDVELHLGKMSFQDAVRMLVNVAKLEESSAIGEVKRYTQNPTQPMSYMVGKMEILKLREQLEEAGGGKLNLKSFHDKLLSYGPVPVGLIAEDMLG
jgi:uncharacterized protein (DUF885 family)